MKTVYSAQNIAVLSIMQSILEGQGITCHVRNQFLSAGSGEIPPVECWPQLCVDDADVAAAQRIIAAADAAPPLAAWRCDGCGEEIEGQFAACWNCGREAPGSR